MSHAVSILRILAQKSAESRNGSGNVRISTWMLKKKIPGSCPLFSLVPLELSPELRNVNCTPWHSTDACPLSIAPEIER